MESTPGKRLQQWREFKGVSLTEMFRITGVKVTTLSTAESLGASNPSYDTITKVLAAYPDLNPDWLLLGTGPMLRDGRALAPLPMQQADYSSGPATVNTVVETLLRERLADKDALIELLRAEVSELRGKSPGSSDAVGHLHAPAPAPLPTVGFRLSVQRRTNKPGMQQSR